MQCVVVIVPINVKTTPWMHHNQETIKFVPWKNEFDEWK
jgi:hypothetical protein